MTHFIKNVIAWPKKK